MGIHWSNVASTRGEANFPGGGSQKKMVLFLGRKSNKCESLAGPKKNSARAGGSFPQKNWHFRNEMALLEMRLGRRTNRHANKKSANKRTFAIQRRFQDEYWGKRFVEQSLGGKIRRKKPENSSPVRKGVLPIKPL